MTDDERERVTFTEYSPGWLVAAPEGANDTPSNEEWDVNDTIAQAKQSGDATLSNQQGV